MSYGSDSWGANDGFSISSAAGNPFDNSNSTSDSQLVDKQVKKPAGTIYCCGNKVEMCEDCPQLPHKLYIESLGISWTGNGWLRNGTIYKTWEQAYLGSPEAKPGDLWRRMRGLFQTPEVSEDSGK